jgi:hypothetical protein
LIAAGDIPGAAQLFPMQSGPFEDQNESASANPAFDDFERLGADLNFFTLIHGMKMRRGVIAEVHPNDDSVEAAEFWPPFGLVLALKRGKL